jgi:hypothetical protein
MKQSGSANHGHACTLSFSIEFRDRHRHSCAGSEPVGKKDCFSSPCSISTRCNKARRFWRRRWDISRRSGPTAVCSSSCGCAISRFAIHTRRFVLHCRLVDDSSASRAPQPKTAVYILLECCCMILPQVDNAYRW